MLIALVPCSTYSTTYEQFSQAEPNNPSKQKTSSERAFELQELLDSVVDQREVMNKQLIESCHVERVDRHEPDVVD